MTALRQGSKPRAAIYARYSTDLQSAASIQDQVRLCHKVCADNGWEIVETFADEAMSGATHLRPGFQALQRAAMNGAFDIIVAEALDRLSRDQEHIAALHKRMGFHDVKIFTKAEGEINEMHIGLGGTMSALFLKNLAQKTHRGLEGRVRDGKSAGGISYGYRAVKTMRADGTVTTGEREIIAEEAAIIQRIFAGYASGLSARALAAQLNAEGISAPDAGKGDGTWGPSTISGNWKRGTGILNNELYIGRLIWNRQRFVKDPTTGKRQARPNPPQDWVIEDVEDLRIIEDDLWHRVKDRQGAIRAEMNPAGVQDGRLRLERAKRPGYLFSGLLKCGCCGANYTLINKTRYGCAGARNRGAAICTNRATVEREIVEDRVLTGLRDRLLHPDLISTFVEEYRLAFNATAAEAVAAHKQAQRDLTQVEKKISGIMAAIEDGLYQPSMKDRLETLKSEKATLSSLLDQTPEPPALRLHPSLSDLYRSKIGKLSESLNEPGLKREATEVLRGLISEVRMIPDADVPTGHRIELAGELAGILALGEADTTKPPRCEGFKSETMVAGVGFEPTTFRL